MELCYQTTQLIILFSHGPLGNDTSLCDLAGDYKGHCYYSLASKLEDASLCEKAEGHGPRCFYEAALRLKDPQYCEESDKIDECYNTVAQQTKDTELCRLAVGHEVECLGCADDEYVKDNACKKLECREDQELGKHTCVDLDCLEHYTARNHKCVPDFLCSDTDGDTNPREEWNFEKKGVCKAPQGEVGTDSCEDPWLILEYGCISEEKCWSQLISCQDYCREENRLSGKCFDGRCGCYDNAVELCDYTKGLQARYNCYRTEGVAREVALLRFGLIQFLLALMLGILVVVLYKARRDIQETIVNRWMSLKALIHPLRTKLVILVLLILIMALMAIFTSQPKKNHEPGRMPADIEYCRNLTDLGRQYSEFSNRLYCYIRYGKEKGNAECNEWEKPLCDIGIAAGESNLSYCNSLECEWGIIALGHGRYCDHNECFFGIGFGTGNTTLCQTLDNPTYRGYCIMGAAIGQGDLKSCELIGVNESQEKAADIVYDLTENYRGSLLRNLCYLGIAERTQEDAICKKASSGYKERCYYGIAQATIDMDLCNHAGPDKERCMRDVLYQQAAERGDVNKCYDMGEYEQYDLGECILMVAKKTRDRSVCGSIPERFGDIIRRRCFLELALTEMDLTICADIGRSTNEEAECYETLSSPDSLDICRNLSIYDRPKCYMPALRKAHNLTTEEFQRLTGEVTQRAIEEDNASICDALGDLKMFCYSQFAAKLGFSLGDVLNYQSLGQDEGLCEQIDEDMRQKCYFNLAIEKLDDTYCMKTGKYLTRCAENVGFLSRNYTRGQVMNLLKLRFSEEGREYGIKSSMTTPAFKDVYNEGSVRMTGSEFNLYLNLKLMDPDGCRGNLIVYPKKEKSSTEEWDLRHCILDISTGGTNGDIIEITYQGQTVYVDYW